MSRALVVDDSRAVRMILSRTLRQIGFDVEEAANGLAALEVLRNEPSNFDLMLLDWNMPEMNGLELLNHVRHDAAFAAIPVVMVTTETEMEHLAAAMDAGANEYVMKPFTPEILVDKLRMIGFEC